MSTLQGQLDKAKQEGNNLRQQVIELQQSSDMKQQETDRYKFVDDEQQLF